MSQFDICLKQNIYIFLPFLAFIQPSLAPKLLKFLWAGHEKLGYVDFNPIPIL